MPRSLREFIAHADTLADSFEAYDPAPGDEGKASSVVALRLAAARRAEADRGVLDAVAAARQHHVPWVTIGSALGTSGEAARQRYSDLVKH